MRLWKTALLLLVRRIFLVRILERCRHRLGREPAVNRPVLLFIGLDILLKNPCKLLGVRYFKDEYMMLVAGTQLRHERTFTKGRIGRIHKYLVRTCVEVELRRHTGELYQKLPDPGESDFPNLELD